MSTNNISFAPGLSTLSTTSWKLTKPFLFNFNPTFSPYGFGPQLSPLTNFFNYGTAAKAAYYNPIIALTMPFYENGENSFSLFNQILANYFQTLQLYPLPPSWKKDLQIFSRNDKFLQLLDKMDNSNNNPSVNTGAKKKKRNKKNNQQEPPNDENRYLYVPGQFNQLHPNDEQTTPHSNDYNPLPPPPPLPPNMMPRDQNYQQQYNSNQNGQNSNQPSHNFNQNHQNYQNYQNYQNGSQVYQSTPNQYSQDHNVANFGQHGYDFNTNVTNPIDNMALLQMMIAYNNNNNNNNIQNNINYQGVIPTNHFNIVANGQHNANNQSNNSQYNNNQYNNNQNYNSQYNNNQNNNNQYNQPPPPPPQLQHLLFNSINHNQNHQFNNQPSNQSSNQLSNQPNNQPNNQSNPPNQFNNHQYDLQSHYINQNIHNDLQHNQRTAQLINIENAISMPAQFLPTPPSDDFHPHFPPQDQFIDSTFINKDNDDPNNNALNNSPNDLSIYTREYITSEGLPPLDGQHGFNIVVAPLHKEQPPIKTTKYNFLLKFLAALHILAQNEYLKDILKQSFEQQGNKRWVTSWWRDKTAITTQSDAHQLKKTAMDKHNVKNIPDSTNYINETDANNAAVTTTTMYFPCELFL